MSEDKVNLFVYGSLRDRRVFLSVSGLNFTRTSSRVGEKTLMAEKAFLAHYRRLSPDNVYFYAVSNPSSRIEGLLIRDVPARAMSEIDKYEGKRYQREMVAVNTAGGSVEATAYLVSHESMKRHFGDRFHVNLIHELWLRKRIDKFIRRHTRPGEWTADAELERRADRELLGTTERDLVITHYGSDAFSDYYLEHELDKPRPSIKHLRKDEEAGPYIKNYLALVVKQILLNQFDERIQSRYRFELEHMQPSERYFKRSISLLASLQMINANSSAVDLIVNKCLETMPYEKYDLIDYVKYGVNAAKSMFDRRVAVAHLNRIHSNLQTGLLPMGIEIEMSNLGAGAVEPQRSIQKKVDGVYNGFKYYYDFYLDVLSWKVGGYIDDHMGSTDQGRRMGFLEFAPGRLNIAGELSRPATADPWLLNQLIHEIVAYYPVSPHSLHISFQLRKHQIGNQKTLPLGFVKCLLALGGGLQKKETGSLWISRMGYDEITQNTYGEELVFARTSKRKWYLSGGEIADRVPGHATTYVQQYKYIRLEERANYEPLILCLKGLQLAYNPGDYLSADQLKGSAKLRREYEELKKWSVKPTRISSQMISRFITAVNNGLMNEGHRGPVHNLHYIDWAISAIDIQLRMFNKQISESPDGF